MKRKFFTVYVFVKLSTRRFFRDRLALFFTIVFPLIFLFVFGGIFGKDNGASFKVALLNDSNNTFATNLVDKIVDGKTIKQDETIKTLDQAKTKMNRGEIDATLLLDKDFGKSDGKYPSGQIKLIYTQNNA